MSRASAWPTSSRCCQPSAYGADCSGRQCPSGCHGNGVCEEGRCVCSAGFRGASCAESDPLFLPHALGAAPEHTSAAVRRLHHLPQVLQLAAHRRRHASQRRRRQLT